MNCDSFLTNKLYPGREGFEASMCQKSFNAPRSSPSTTVAHLHHPSDSGCNGDLVLQNVISDFRNCATYQKIDQRYVVVFHSDRRESFVPQHVIHVYIANSLSKRSNPVDEVFECPLSMKNLIY